MRKRTRRKGMAYTGPAKGHPRYGSRATRTASKFGVQPIEGERLKQILEEACRCAVRDR